MKLSRIPKQIILSPRKNGMHQAHWMIQRSEPDADGNYLCISGDWFSPETHMDLSSFLEVISISVEPTSRSEELSHDHRKNGFVMNALSSLIAKNSRRGCGNFMIMGGLPRFDPSCCKVENFIRHDSLKPNEVLMIYQGGTASDYSLSRFQEHGKDREWCMTHPNWIDRHLFIRFPEDVKPFMG